MFKPTPEQDAALAAFATGAPLVLQAGAGTGKTSTLKLLAASASDRKGIYIAYNKAIADEAKKTFPRNVTCGTAHSFAYRAVGRLYRDRLNGPRKPAHEIAKILGINEPVILSKDAEPLRPKDLARLVQGMVTRFCQSASRAITANHLPSVAGLDDPATRRALGTLLLPYAVKAWADITQTAGRMPFTHDYYLKIWQLSEPRLGADFILLDEAQDSNPVVVDVVKRQGDHGAQLIAVGDSAQQIYGWRGADDAMGKWGGQTLTLSKSFRFGPAVADEANKFLEMLDAPLRLEGHEPLGSIVARLERPEAILCRSNAGAVKYAMDAIAAGRRTALVGGGDGFRRMAQAAITLMAGAGTDHPELFAFKTWADVQDYVEHDEGGSDLKSFVSMIDKHGADVLIGVVDSLVPENRAQVVVSTAHKAKGREWGTVKIGDDFTAPPQGKDGKRRVSRAELMLMYVVVTRAMQILDCESLAWVHGEDVVVG